MEASNIRHDPALGKGRERDVCFGIAEITYSFGSLPPHKEDPLSERDGSKTIQGPLLQGIWLLRSSCAHMVRDLDWNAVESHQGVGLANLMSAKWLEQKTPV